MPIDYSKTVNLPKTEFPMKGELPKREPEILKTWEGLYERILDRTKDRPAYVLHDGPPYANGHTHIGHALNKILKDMTVKSRGLMGFRTPYVPGWDCHGLPIESALLKELKISKRAVVDIPAFRRQASAFAKKFIGIQREEFIRLGVLGDWGRPYQTMNREYEALILRVFRVLMGKGCIYRGLKSVPWCVTCETALAEAEIEYKDKSSPSVYVALPIQSPKEGFSGAEIVVWTTTPWTLPANMAAAFHPDLEYVLCDVRHPAWAKPRRLLVGRSRLESVLKALGASGHAELKSFKGKDLARADAGDEGPGLIYRRPFGDQEGIGVLAGYVTAEDGTGIVHTAPGHGADDFETGKRFGLKTLCPVDGRGHFTAEAGAALAGKQIFTEGNHSVIKDLAGRGLLLALEQIQHSYPHCWRCQNPIAFRATEQWFLDVAHDGLRGRLLEAIRQVRWVPEVGRTRIASMVEGRPDWCLSRQRVWGTPIPVLYCLPCGKPLTDDSALEAIEKKVQGEGTDFWFQQWGEAVAPQAMWALDLKCACGGGSFRREQDILDVWIDSGASWLAVDPNAGQPSDLYLEGSDQHRGWFQSSLVLSVAARGRPPYKAVLTHGFVLDERGRAMHKSLGNVVSPEEVIKKYGADVLRLWAALADYSDDVRLSDKLLEGPRDAYRKIRNTLRYLLGNIWDFPGGPRPERLGELERYALSRLAAVQRAVLGHYEAFRYRSAARELADYCSQDLSSFVLDVLKDRLYTFAADSPDRRAAQWVLAEILKRLLRLLSPILSFTAEEAWGHLPERLRGAPSVFLADLEAPDPGWTDPGLDARWARVRAARETALKRLEALRVEGRIGSSLQARIVLSGGGLGELGAVNWPEVLIVSEVELKDGADEIVVDAGPAEGAKCSRCWRLQKDVGTSAAHPGLCARCVRELGS